MPQAHRWTAWRGGEGAFLACSFWLADTYVLAGRLAEATLLFERLLELGSDLGLFAEEYDSDNDMQVGNFPQAFTHVSVVHTALLISEGVAPALSMGRWLGPAGRIESVSAPTSRYGNCRVPSREMLHR
jgi:hypothetical protein